MQQRFEDDGLQVRRSASRTDEDCVACSYGTVDEGFRDHPCAGVERAWYEVADDQGNTAIVSVAWVRMPDEDGATELQGVVDRPGTGNVTELSRVDGPFREVRYNGRYYRSTRDGATFTSIQAEPLQNTAGAREVARRASGSAATAA